MHDQYFKLMHILYWSLLYYWPHSIETIRPVCSSPSLSRYTCTFYYFHYRYRPRRRQRSIVCLNVRFIWKNYYKDWGSGKIYSTPWRVQITTELVHIKGSWTRWLHQYYWESGVNATLTSPIPVHPNSPCIAMLYFLACCYANLFCQILN